MSSPLAPLPSLLVSQLRAGRVIPFLGAGLSRAAGLPDWQELLGVIVSWGEGRGISPTRAALIREEIAQRKFLQVANALQRDLGDALFDALREILAPAGLAPTPLHRRLSCALWHAVITTNFDSLIPSCFADYKIITWKDQHAIGDVLKSREAHVMMVHGWLDQPETIVLGPQQYSESSHNPALTLYRQTLLSHNSFLFLGVSFADQDLLHFLDAMRTILGPPSIPHFALLPRGQVTALDVEYFRETFGVEAICYDETPNHAEVGHFVDLVIDQLPPELLSDPSVRLEALTALQAARGKVTENKYLRQFRDACIRLASDGLIRTARTALVAEYRQATTSLAPAERLATAIAIADLQIAEHETEFAHQPLLDLLESLDDASIDIALRLKFGATTIRILLAGYFLQDARRVFDRLSVLGIQDSLIEHMHAEMILAEYLNNGSLPKGTSNDALARAVIAEGRAMSGHLDAELQALDVEANEREEEGRLTDAAVLRQKRTELLFNDGQDQAAWDECERMHPLVSGLTTAQHLAFQRNQEFLGLLLNRPPQKPSVARPDQEHPTKPEHARLQRLVEAHESSREQRLYESLPPLWQELCRNFKVGSWGGRRHAHQQMAKETLAANWYREALHHAVLGSKEELSTAFGEAIIATRDIGLIDYVVGKLLERSCLLRHIEPTARILAVIADVIPDHRVQEVLTWLLHTLARKTSTPQMEQLIIKGWKATQELMFRFSQEQLHAVLSFARVHPYLQGNGWGRQSLLNTIASCITRLDSGDWTALTNELLPIATTKRWDGDFESALRTLRELARRSDEAKAVIGDALLPDETSGTDLRVLALAKEFGRSVRPDGITTIAARVVAELPLMVWHGEGEPPKFQLSSIVTQRGTHDGKTLQIEIRGGQTELAFLRKHQDQLAETEWNKLFETVMALLQNPLNLRENQAMLMEFLEDTAPHLNTEQASIILRSLQALVNGTAPVSPAELAPPHATDRMKMEGLTKEQIQAIALQATAIVLQRFPSLINGDFLTALGQAALNPDSTLRRLASDILPGLLNTPRELQILLMTATQDTDARVAATALDCVKLLYENGELQQDGDLLMGLTQRTATSHDPLIRRLATRLALALHQGNIAPEARVRLEELLVTARNDLHFSVRTAAN